MVIRYHASWPSTADPYYQYNTSENNTRIQYMPPHTDGERYTPYMWIDGTVRGGYETGAWGSLIADETDVESPLEINITGNFNTVNRTGQAIIRVIATDAISYSSLKLRIAITESNINWLAPNGTRWHNQTFRDMMPNTNGITFAITEGDTLTFTQSFSCPTAINYHNSHIVAFVQSDTDKQILQGGKVLIDDLIYELSSFSLISPYDDTTLGICTPLFLWHHSADPDSGYPISYQVLFSRHSNFDSTFISDAVVDTFWQCPVCLYNDSTYYWKILASNGHAPDRFSAQTYNLLIDEGEVLVSPPALSNISMAPDDTFETAIVLTNDSYFDVSYTLSDSGTIISFESDSGHLDTMGVDTVIVYLSSVGLPPGSFSDTIYIETTHPITNFIKVPISISTGFAYLPGDVNMYNGQWPPTVIGGDVTYLVNYFRGSPTNSACRLGGFWGSADINGDCNVIGSDVTRLVNFFRGLGSVGHCADYPPAWMSAEDLPAEEPPNWPGCE